MAYRSFEKVMDHDHHSLQNHHFNFNNLRNTVMIKDLENIFKCDLTYNFT